MTDVHLTAFTTGFKEDIVVGAFTGNHVYAYELHTSGLTASLSGQEILLSDAQGHMLAKLEAPNMTDASGRYSTNIAVSISGGGGSYRLTYTPDAEWMAQAAYPSSSIPADITITIWRPASGRLCFRLPTGPAF